MNRKTKQLVHLVVMLTFFACIVVDAIWFITGSMNSWSSFTNDNIIEASRLNFMWFTLLPAAIIASLILVILGFRKNKLALKVTGMIISLIPVLFYLFISFVPTYQ